MPHVLRQRNFTLFEGKCGGVPPRFVPLEVHISIHQPHLRYLDPSPHSRKSTRLSDSACSLHGVKADFDVGSHTELANSDTTRRLIRQHGHDGHISIPSPLFNCMIADSECFLGPVGRGLCIDGNRPRVSVLAKKASNNLPIPWRGGSGLKPRAIFWYGVHMILHSLYCVAHLVQYPGTLHCRLPINTPCVAPVLLPC